ncbi:hypothetical protein T439DRAFT_326537 [Meredithblackwellia eburnea MCA 4105]
MDLYATSLQDVMERGLDVVRPKKNPKARAALQNSLILDLICSQLTRAMLCKALLVSRAFHDSAKRELLKDVSYYGRENYSKFERRILADPELGWAIRTVRVTNGSLPSLHTLVTLTPNLRCLIFTATSQPTTEDIIKLLKATHKSLRQLMFIGQDLKSHRRLEMNEEREGEVGRALRAVADQGGLGLRLASLSILATAITPVSLERFLEVCGGELTHLSVESCGIGPALPTMTERWCKGLKGVRLDCLQSSRTPPPAPRHLNLSTAISLTSPIIFPQSLSSLHFSSLPHVDPSVFRLFASPTHAHLKEVSFEHCSIATAHLSYFAFVNRLRIVACPNVWSIPIFPSRGWGPGCRELRHLSVLGGEGISAGNLWELVSLGQERLSKEELELRRSLGLGQRGLKKLTIDGTLSRQHPYTIDGEYFTVPPSDWALPVPFAQLMVLNTNLPDPLSVPDWLVDHVHKNILSRTLTNKMLARILRHAKDLEVVGLFGHIKSRGEPEPLPEPPHPDAPLTELEKAFRDLSYYAYIGIFFQFICIITDHPNYRKPRCRHTNPKIDKNRWDFSFTGHGVPTPVRQVCDGDQGKRLTAEEVDSLISDPQTKLVRINA